jgi:ketosteroid isomerase-like protein
MSEESIEVVRMPMTLEAQPHRRLEERLALRFPRLRAFLGRAVWRLPNSRLRRALVRRVVKLGWEAFNRGDLDVTFALYHPSCESSFPAQLATVGFPSGTRDREARIRVQREVFDDWRELWFELKEYIDLTDGRLLTVGRMRGIGLSSGAAVDTEWTATFTTIDGQVVREQIFVDNREALEAAGLAE